MSRSLHTRPAQLLAAARTQDPYAPRRQALRAERRSARALKQRGIVLDPERDAQQRSPRLPRMTLQRPLDGYHHPLNVAQISVALRRLGPEPYYGLRTIRLVQGDGADQAGALVFGRLYVPGSIVLYALPRSPWLLAGAMPAAQQARLIAAGALIAPAGDGLHIRVEWPGDTLRAFMLFDVLLHELGHHHIQQYTGKRPARVLRTRDHERRADALALRWRERYQALEVE